MGKSNCEIIRDLLPLYIDDACSEHSKIFIEEHLGQCSQCQEILALMQDEGDAPRISLEYEDKKALEIMKKINNKILKKYVIIALLTTIIIGGLWLYFFIFETNNPYKNYGVTEISNVEDIMYYFKYAFFPYIVLFIVVAFNLFKAIYYSKNKLKNFGVIDLIIDMICGIAMYAGMIFQGVLADNNALTDSPWLAILMIISLVSFIMFIVNLILVIKSRLEK